MKRVCISDLKSHLSEHLRSAESGSVIEVVDRARPIARLVPIEREAEVELISAARSFVSVRNVRLPAIKGATSSLEALRADREQR